MTYSSEVLADSPLAYYRLGESSGTTLVDSSGNGRNGSYSGAYTLGVAGLVSGDADTCVDWGGGLATVAKAAWMETTGLTIEALFQTDTLTSVDVIAARADWTTGFGPAYSWALYRENDHILVEVFRDNSSTRVGVTSGALTTGTTYHVAATYDGSTVRLYLNGVSVGTPAALAAPLSPGTSPLTIGRTPYAGDGAFDGRIDEVAFYGSALSAARIGAHYTAATSTAVTVGLSLAGTLPAIQSDLTLASFTDTRTANRVNGRIRDGRFIDETETPVVPVPARMVRAARVEQAFAYPDPTLVDGRPSDASYASTKGIEKTALRDQVVVDGVDITYLRDQALPTPSYELIQPFGYGPGTIRVPQVRPYLEAKEFGKGDLSWVRKGAFVKIRRVNPDTDTVEAKDYRGRVTAVNADGPELVLEVGGLVEGPTELREHQVPVYRRVKDIGRWMFDGLVNYGNLPGVHFEPRLGPTTGIDAVETGGMTHLGWLQQLCSLAITKAGVQWTVMPVEAGSHTFEMRTKDTTTVHATIWVDSDRAVARLVDDTAASFNAGYGTGITNDGMIWDGTVLPGIEDAPDDEAPYPGSPLSIGDSGESVIAVNWQLIWAGFLSREEASPDYDADTADAVEDFQKRAGLPETGVVNQATWDALYDISETEWDISGARIMPIVEDDAVREWDYTSTGAKIRRNPKYDRNVLRSDRNVDFGAGVTEQQGRRWLRGQMRRYSGKSWAGQINIAEGVAVFAGQHNDPSTVTEADVISARDIQAGWNVWLPNFDGGTLVHVARNAYAGSSTLDVDTHYRDSLELGEIIANCKESRRDLRREWKLEYRGSKKIHDSITPFNQKAGRNRFRRVAKANEWKVFPIFVGQAGTISKLRIVTDTAKAAFCYAIFADKISAATLTHRVPNPWLVDSDGETVWSDPALEDWRESRFLLYSGGNIEQPGGYFPKKKTNRDRETTANPITGVWEDDASIGYATFRVPALWVAIQPDRDTVIQRGRMLWAQLETGV